MMADATVTNIQGYSIHDGPGIRTTVFLKGCPLRCRWCANPENLSPEPQVGFIKEKCLNCGHCLRSCSEKAIRPQGYKINQALCDACGFCAADCPYEALVLYGKRMTAQEVFAKVRRDRMFYESSGGGVTLSGGEPLTHPDFAAELFSLCRGEGIGTCVETCGAVSFASLEKVLPVTDLFLFDIKLVDGEKHRAYTGSDNRLILENARRLVSGGANVLFRQPLIPGVNDAPKDIAVQAAFLLGIGRPQLQLMPYHRMGLSKYTALNIEPQFDTQPMSPEAVEAARKLYQEHGIACSVSK